MSVSFSFRHPHTTRGIEIHNLPFDETPTLLLGVNGAGKTTLLRVLARELRPQRGQAPKPGSVVYIPQKFTPIRGFTVLDYAAYVAWLHGQNRSRAGKNARSWVEFVGLTAEINQDCNRLSGGQQAKLQLAAGLNAGARTLLLDEPSASLDPIAKTELQQLYSTIINDGIGLWVSTHQPHEVAPPFTRVVVLDRGQVIFSGGLANFSQQADNNEASPTLSKLAQATR